MKIIVVDNQIDRLEQSAKEIMHNYPDSEIEKFNDPYMAIKYSMLNKIDIIFTRDSIPLLGRKKLIEGIRHFNVDVKDYMLAAEKMP